MTEIKEEKEKIEVQTLHKIFQTPIIEIYEATYKIYPSKIDITVCYDKNNQMSLSIANQSELDTQEENFIKKLTDDLVNETTKKEAAKLELLEKKMPMSSKELILMQIYNSDLLIQTISNAINARRRVFQVLKANKHVKQLKK